MAITKEILATMLASHKPMGRGDVAELVYVPFKGDVFGNTKELNGYWYQGENYIIGGFDATTGMYTTADEDNSAAKIPFYCLKLIKKNDGRSVMAGTYEGRISTNGKTVEFGCQTATLEQVQNVYETMLKVQKAYKPKPKKVVAKATAKKTIAKKKAR